MQSTTSVLMIRPVDFRFNAETAANNKFQQLSDDTKVHENALAEFDYFVDLLRKNGVSVIVIDDTLSPATPDSIFPNNWISFHEDGSIFLYPMFSQNRRSERRMDVIDALRTDFEVSHIGDLSFFEQQNLYLEGTGSMVLDREHKLAYACLSERTNAEVLDNFSMLTGYIPVTFSAVDQQGYPIYHTNVMMCIGDAFAVVCLESIPDALEREDLRHHFLNTHKELIEISMEQMNQFAGNMLQLRSTDTEPILVMSEQAYKSLNQQQINSLSSHCKILHAPLYTIEKNGGGSARCMLAEIHLPKKIEE